MRSEAQVPTIGFRNVTGMETLISMDRFWKGIERPKKVMVNALGLSEDQGACGKRLLSSRGKVLWVRFYQWASHILCL